MKFLLYFFLVAVNGQLLSSFEVDDQPYSAVTLQLNEGTIRGRRLENVDVYRAVPYALPAKRFQMAEPITQFNGEINAENFGPTCYQEYLWPLKTTVFEDDVAAGMVSEDCLTVDIYIPNNQANSNSQRAILFWIYGGAWISGDTSSYSGIEQAVYYGNIVVLVQYRLGIYGYLNSYDDSSDVISGGNYGLGDQALALKFTSENAARMGGDVNKIVINGESAGSASVMSLLLHDASASLVSGALAQSGATFLSFLSLNSPTNQINLTIRYICESVDGCDHNLTIDEQIAQLKTVDPLLLWNASKQYSWEPVACDGKFFTESSKEKFDSGNLNTDFKLMLGVSSFEGSLVSEYMEYANGLDEMIELAEIILQPSTALNEWNDVMNDTLTIKNVYEQTLEDFQSYARVDKLNDKHNRFIISQMVGDISFMRMAVVDAKKYSDAGVKTYMYLWDFHGGYIFRNGSMPGLGHGEDALIYTFGAYRLPHIAIDEPWVSSVGETLGTTISNFLNSDVDPWEQFAHNDSVMIVQKNETHAITYIAQDHITKFHSPHAIAEWKRLAQNGGTTLILSTYFILTSIFYY